MPLDEEIAIGPELSHDFQNFEELYAENSGQELQYLEIVGRNPLEIDPVTLAFSLTQFLRLSPELMDMLLMSMSGDSEPELKTRARISWNSARQEECRDFAPGDFCLPRLRRAGSAEKSREGTGANDNIKGT